MIPKDLRYHQEHEWVRVSGTQATVGISHFAQDALCDIVFIDMPKPGTVVTAGQQIGEVESTKTTSTIYTPVSGTIATINTDLKDHPEVVIHRPHPAVVPQFAFPSRRNSRLDSIRCPPCSAGNRSTIFLAQPNNVQSHCICCDRVGSRSAAHKAQSYRRILSFGEEIDFDVHCIPVHCQN